jgi:2-dehydropantoate 2-reductase
VPLGVVARDHYDELAQLLSEIKSVANAKGIALEEKNEQNVLARVSSVPFDSKTSMQLDYEAGKQTEVEALTGYIVREGQRLGIETPLMERIYQKLA